MRPYFETQNAPIRISGSAPFPFPDHLHMEAELLYLFGGTAAMRVGGALLTLHPGDLCLCFPGVVHSYLESSDAEALMMIFSPALFPDFTSRLTRSLPRSPLLTADRLPADVGLCARQLLLESDQAIDEPVLKGYLQVLLARTVPLLSLAGRPPELTDVSYEILKYLSLHFTEPVTLESLARALNVSRSCISHTFSQRIGANFRTYVNALRVDHACSLLRATDRSVTDIAYACGFESQRTFNRAFFDQYGLTPSQYRRAQQKNHSSL